MLLLNITLLPENRSWAFLELALPDHFYLTFTDWLPYWQKVKLLHIKRRFYEFPSFFKPSAQWHQYQTFWVCQVNEKALSLPWMRSKPSRRAVSESLLFIRMSFFYYDCWLLFIRVVFPTLGNETFNAAFKKSASLTETPT